ncbi:FadR/GntR family transcriptional regulator [Paenibacillus turpanensis]|uniref:FadR/GntR family transcriptional regulator n=1 Tax=Paenibacillus turpanensis TaxID=2689078 RepID=UPI0014086DCB|nr:FadR/GntR family transcriptional regulator [Paenibacillus turpanensis]
MDVTKLVKRNHYEEITEQLKRMIEESKLKVGERLPSTKELSESFGVGRSTMREALSALKAMGLIDIRQGGGATVIRSSAIGGMLELPELKSLRMNKATLLELMEARQSLEASNAAIAAERAAAADLDALRRIVEEMELAIGDEVKGERTDVLFHLTLVKATGNSILVRLYESIMQQTEAAIRDIRRVKIYADPSVGRRLYEEHLAIYEAIALRDPLLASRRMKEHLQHVAGILAQLLT